MSKKYYKCLRLNRASWYDESFIWPAKSAVEVGGAQKGNPCGMGLHLAKSIDDSFRYGRFPSRIFEVKPLSPVLGEDDTKIRVAKARLMREVTPDYVRAVNQFLVSIPKIKWLKNHRPPKPEWKLFDTRNAAQDAAGHVANETQDEIWVETTARDAAFGAAWDQAEIAARHVAMNAAKDVAWEKAHVSAWDRVWDADVAENAARGTARGAAWDAALYAQMLICQDLDFEKQYINYIKVRWDVWKRGYGLLCDINDIFYVYCKL